MAPDSSQDQFDGEDVEAADSEHLNDAGSGASAGRPTRTGRLSQSFSKFTQGGTSASAGDASEGRALKLTEAQKAKAIAQIDQNERRIGYAGSALVVVVALLFCLPYVANPKKTQTNTINRVGKRCPDHYKSILVKGAHQCTGLVSHSRNYWITEMLIILAFAVFIFIATRVGKRSLLAFALLFGGLAIDATTGSIIGLIFIVGGGWLLVRAYRVQKYGTTNAREVAQLNAERRAAAKAGGKAPAAAARSTGRATKEPKAGKKAKAAATTPDGRTKPSPNKRYTPKAPPRKKPPPPE